MATEQAKGYVKRTGMKDIYNIDWINIDGNYIHRTAVINHDFVKLGKGNVIGPYTCIGTNGEIRGTKHTEFNGRVVIGNNNVISEHVTIQRPKNEGATTIVGNDNILMAHCHVGHDVAIGDSCEICTGVILGGYCQVWNNVKIKIGSVVRNRVVILDGALVGMGSVVTKSVAQDDTVYGNPAKPQSDN